MKSYRAILILCILVAAVQLYVSNDHISMQKEVKAFIEEGGRNTKNHGLLLCLRQNAIAAKVGEPQIDCAALYRTKFPNMQDLIIPVQ